MFTVNPNPSYKPVPYKGDGWQEMAGATCIPFLKQVTWEKAGTCEVLQKREIDKDGKGGFNDISLPAMLYKGNVKGRTVGLLIGNVQSPMRAFAVSNDAAYDSLLAQLQANRGFVDEQMKEVGKVFTNNDAQSLYAWEAKFFGADGTNARAVAKIAPASRTKSKKLVQSIKAELVDEKEAVNLVKEIAKRYDVFNVEVDFGAFDGRLLGYAQATADQITPLARPVGIRLWFARDILYKHTVIHECAHAIEMFKTGVGGHGQGFRTIYKLLLRQYHGLTPTGI